MDPLLAELILALDDLEWNIGNPFYDEPIDRRAIPYDEALIPCFKRIFKAKANIARKYVVGLQMKKDPQPKNRDPYNQLC